MTEFQINDYLLQKECDDLAAEIFADFKDRAGDDFDPEDCRDDMFDRAHEYADGHEWVIYNYKALMLCAHCDTSLGEDFTDDVGINWVPGESTIYTVATAIAYGEIKGRIDAALHDLIDNYEPA